MRKIIILTTGGTIASTEGVMGRTPALSGEELLERIPVIPHTDHIEVQNILSLDSTNLNPEHWIQIATKVCEEIDNYDGIVITHGTDTLAYTAAALYCMLKNPHKPIVLTGSQIPLTMEGSDGPRNLAEAVQVAAEGIRGVSVVFGGRIISGSSVRKMYTNNLDAFRSLNVPQMGTIRDGEIILSQPLKPGEGKMKPDTRICPDVFLLKLVPGISADIIPNLVKMGYRGIVIEGYGCGGVPSYLLEGVKAAIRQGVAIVLSTQCEYDGVDLSLYEVGRTAALAGVISGGRTTSEMAVVKLMWVLGHTRDLQQVRQGIEEV